MHKCEKVVVTDNPHYTDTLYNDTIRYNANLTGMETLLKKWQLIGNYARLLELILPETFGLAMF